MIYQDLEKLIHSLSAAERRQFYNYANQLKGEKYYLSMYNLILDNRFDQNRTWELDFVKKYPSVSFDSIANYLYKVLSDVLVQMRIEQNEWYQQLYGLMKAKLCFERSLNDRGKKELKAVSKKAVKGENYINSYLAIRMELDTLQTADSVKIDEQELINRQMEAKMKLKSINELHDHYSLFELLLVRLSKKVYQQSFSSDLIFSELNLVFNKRTPRFETKKMHLMFQSFYFIHKSEYESALKVFEELSELFESNPFLWNSPPYDYLSIFDGILNALRSTSQFDRMEEFIDKIEDLIKRGYSEHFIGVATEVSTIYQLNFFVMTGNFQKGRELVKSREKLFYTGGVDERLLIEYFYFSALIHFLERDFSKAKRVLNELFNKCYSALNIISFRAAKLLFIMTIYEVDDNSFLESEIRAYKRLFQKVEKMYKIEKLVFKLIRLDPKRRGNEWKKSTLISVEEQLNVIVGDRSDMSLIKFFDYNSWVLRLLKKQ